MTAALFARNPVEQIADGAFLLPTFALPRAGNLLASIDRIAATAPFRHHVTPGGKPMSVAMTSAGDLGWTSDRRGYRYSPVDPATGAAWPAMPPTFRELASAAARAAGFDGFVPDSCLVNRYAPSARMGLHQDRDEADMAWPIVSVSLGLPVMFLWGGPSRSGTPRRLLLEHGDVVVWGGPARLAFHGVAPLKPGHDPACGAFRINLTFRRAG